MSPEEALKIVRQICSELPGSAEKLSHGSPCFFVEKQGQFAAFVDNHHGDGNLGLWLAAPLGVQEVLIQENPTVFFRPAYVGGKGWIGVRMDQGLPLEELHGLIAEAHSLIFAKKRR